MISFTINFFLEKIYKVLHSVLYDPTMKKIFKIIIFESSSEFDIDLINICFFFLFYIDFYY